MIDRRSAIFRGLAAGAVILSPTGVLPQPTSPEQLRDLAEDLDKSLEFLSADKIVGATREGMTVGRGILKETRSGSSDRTTTAAALGMLGATQAPALWGLGHRDKAWSAYRQSAMLLAEGQEPARVLWVTTQQISSLVIKDMPVMAVALAQQARRFAQKTRLTGHSNYARFLVCGEVRALIAVGHYGSAHDSLAEAVEMMATAPTADHVGLNQNGMSVPEFDVSVATRYNELADADPRDTYTHADRYQAASYAKRAWPELDKAGATGLRSYARIEMARTLLHEDPEGAAELLLDVIEISRERPMEQIIGKWDLAARQLADKDVGLSRTLTAWKKQWKIQQDERTRRFWER